MSHLQHLPWLFVEFLLNLLVLRINWIFCRNAFFWKSSVFSPGLHLSLFVIKCVYSFCNWMVNRYSILGNSGCSFNFTGYLRCLSKVSSFSGILKSSFKTASFWMLQLKFNLKDPSGSLMVVKSHETAPFQIQFASSWTDLPGNHLNEVKNLNSFSDVKGLNSFLCQQICQFAEECLKWRTTLRTIAHAVPTEFCEKNSSCKASWMARSKQMSWLTLRSLNVFTILAALPVMTEITLDLVIFQ